MSSDAHLIFKKISKGAKFTKKLKTPKIATQEHLQSKDAKPTDVPYFSNSVNAEANSEIKPAKDSFATKNFEDDTHDSESTNLKSNRKRKAENSLDNELNNYDLNVQNQEIKEEKNDECDELTLLNGITSGPKIKCKKQKRKITDEARLEELKKEEINHYRKLNKITVSGSGVPPPIKSFEELEIKPDLLENLQKCGYSTPTPIQMQALPLMMADRQILACAPTGSGKTAAFLLPIIQNLGGPQRLGFRALIICPTRELAKQTQRECERISEGRGFKIHIINKVSQAAERFGPKSNKKFDVLISTPNRLLYLLSQDPPGITLNNVKWLVVDEADKLFETGVRGFREQLDQIVQSCTSADLKIAMFSATYSPLVAKWCRHNMKGLVSVTIGQRNAAADTVDQELRFCGSEEGKLIAFRELVHSGLTPPVLVFVQSKERAQQLFTELLYDGIHVDAIHADRTQLQRDNTVKSFREGRIWVLICTELMARGIDFKGVNLVINYDFPPSSISYIHRIGRAGRAGRKGKAITFFTIDDVVNLRSIAHVLVQSGCEVPEYMLKLKNKSKAERKKLQVSAPQREDIVKLPHLKRKCKVKPKPKKENVKVKGLKRDEKFKGKFIRFKSKEKKPTENNSKKGKLKKKNK